MSCSKRNKALVSQLYSEECKSSVCNAEGTLAGVRVGGKKVAVVVKRVLEGIATLGGRQGAGKGVCGRQKGQVQCGRTNAA